MCRLSMTPNTRESAAYRWNCRRRQVAQFWAYHPWRGSQSRIMKSIIHRLLDDFETPPYLWSADGNVQLSNSEIIDTGHRWRCQGRVPTSTSCRPTRQTAAVRMSSADSSRVAQDWSNATGLSFWYYGQNSGKNIGCTPHEQSGHHRRIQRMHNWSGATNSTARTAQRRIATSGAEKSAMALRSVIQAGAMTNSNTIRTAPTTPPPMGMAIWRSRSKKADGAQQCYYGPCQYTSARLLTKNRFEVAYGRVEARIKVPSGAGLWPAFWMLGTDIDQVNWPQTGEIDIMEHVGRLPNQIFGTLHGPGYSGGQSYGRFVDLKQAGRR